ncbi:Basic leucine zipper 9 [Abeliophyllum distichum]|uniref:Basic leucine zipper 9 n=1 Tax=Abeliophyllum distichum TaxID=126358 RepID=A0ABD1TXG7_9LAMI
MKNNTSIFGCGDFRRSPSELVLHELFASEDEKKTQQKVETFCGSDDDFFVVEDGGIFFPFKNSETPLSSCSSFADNQFLSGNLTTKHPNILATTDSISSISGVHNFTRFQQVHDSINSPSSGTKPNGQDNQPAIASSGSSLQQSDEYDLQIEAGSCEQSTDHVDIKRHKRLVSNRESAQRSRRRKQAHLTELNQEVDKLNGEHDTISAQLDDATQKFKDAATNNRVLKSDVEALRAKVKLAEDMVARGSLNSSLSHLLQNYLNTPQIFMNTNISRMDNISSTITFHGDDHTLYPRLTSSAIGHENAETFNGSISNGVMSDAASGLSAMWP